MNTIKILGLCAALLVVLPACADATSQPNQASQPATSMPTPTTPPDSPTATAQAASPAATVQAASPAATVQAASRAATPECPDRRIQITAYTGHLLVDIDVPENERADSVKLFIPDEDVTIPVGVGSVLNHGAVLQLEDGTAATVLCDTTLRPVAISSPGDTLANACAPPAGTLIDDGLRIDTPRGPGLDTPFIISPLAPNLATLPNVVRWNHTGADSYTLCLFDGLEEIECEENISPTVVEPTPYAAVSELPARQVAVYELENMPELPLDTYIMEITESYPETRTPPPQQAERLITLLGEQSDEVTTAAQDAERARSNLDTRGVSAEIQTLAAAHIYMAADMYDDALNLLEPLTQSQNTDVRLSAYMLIAQMYAQNDLAYEAIETYQAALEIVQEDYPTHIRRLAAIRLGYGRAWLSFGHAYIDQARPHLNEARDLYMRLNSTDRVCWINDQLKDPQDE